MVRDERQLPGTFMGSEFATWQKWLLPMRMHCLDIFWCWDSHNFLKAGQLEVPLKDSSY